MSSAPCSAITAPFAWTPYPPSISVSGRLTSGSTMQLPPRGADEDVHAPHAATREALPVGEEYAPQASEIPPGVRGHGRVVARALSVGAAREARRGHMAQPPEIGLRR